MAHCTALRIKVLCSQIELENMFLTKSRKAVLSDCVFVVADDDHNWGRGCHHHHYHHW